MTVEEFEEVVDREAKMDAMVEALVELEDEPLTNDPDAVTGGRGGLTQQAH